LSGYLRRSIKKLIHLRVIIWASAENIDALKGVGGWGGVRNWNMQII